MTPDEQEALSRRYSDDVILLLPLKSGAIAVFNNARTLCGFVDETCKLNEEIILQLWHPPEKPAPRKRQGVDLEELGLL